MGPYIKKTKLILENNIHKILLSILYQYFVRISIIILDTRMKQVKITNQHIFIINKNILVHVFCFICLVDKDILIDNNNNNNDNNFH